MTVVGRLVARQSGAGKPIAINYQSQSHLGTDPSPNRVGIGVTTTTTPPVHISDLAHADTQGIIEDGVFVKGGMETFAYTQNLVSRAYQRYQDTNTWNQFSKAVDANYAAGRYLWAFETVDDPAVGGSALSAIAGPYHIR